MDLSGVILFIIIIAAAYLTYTRYVSNESKDSKKHEELYFEIKKRCEHLATVSQEAKEVYEQGFKRWVDASVDRVSWRLISFLSFLFSIITTTVNYIIFSNENLTQKPLNVIALSLFVNVVVLFLTLSSIRTWFCYHVVTIH